MLSQKRRNKILLLREQGLPYKEIVRLTEVSYTSVAFYCSQYKPELKNIAIRNKYSEYLDKITLMRRRGSSIKRISEATGLAVNTIRRTCNIYCPGLRNIAQRKITFRQEQEIIQYYKYRYTIKQIAEMVKVSEQTIRRILRRHNMNPQLMYKLNS